MDDDIVQARTVNTKEVGGEEEQKTTGTEEASSSGGQGGGPREVVLDPGQPVPFMHEGRSVGRLSKDGLTYLTSRDKAKHYAYTMDGYGLQRRLLRALMAQGVKRIVLDVRDGNHARRFVMEPETWWRLGTHACLRAQDGAQVFVTLRQLDRFGNP